MKVKVVAPIKKALFFLTGETRSMKLEHRIFNSMCMMGIVIIGYNIPFSYFIGLKLTAFIYFLMFLSLCISYYYARVKNKYKLGIIALSSIVITMISGSFFFTNGIYGPALIALTIAFFIIMIVSSKRHYWIWTSVSVLSGTGLIIGSYFYPEMVSSPYFTRAGLFMDMGSSFIIGILVIFAGLNYVKTAYYQEKTSAEQRAATLEQMNGEKTKFFSIISHDLRAPLASIQSYMELLKVYDMSMQERLMLEQKLSNAVAGTQEMLNNLLSWSKSQLNSSNVDLMPYPIDEVLGRVIDSQKIAALEKKITLSHDIDTSINLLCDVNMLQLVIRNLTGNAIKFTPEHGKIEVLASISGNNCLITVKDNGKGIALKNTAAVFSLKAESTFGTANEKGIGLGLYLCKEYTTAQNGKIWFESKPEEGSSFFVSLPLAN